MSDDKNWYKHWATVGGNLVHDSGLVVVVANARASFKEESIVQFEQFELERGVQKVDLTKRLDGLLREAVQFAEGPPSMKRLDVATLLATHTVKVFNAKIKQAPIIARIIGDVPKNVICSKTIKLDREVFSAPVNAANLKLSKASKMALGGDFAPVLPGITDPEVKQLLLPTGKEQCVNGSPVYSHAVLHEAWGRFWAAKIPVYIWNVQPTPQALPNHGEILMRAGGNVKLLRRDTSSWRKSSWTGDYVCLQANVNGANISSGMLAVGWPAVTAVGGAVHVIERATGIDKIRFAYAAMDSSWRKGPKRADTFSNNEVKPGFNTEEITANFALTLLLDGPDLDAVAAAAKELQRIAGGSLFDIRVSVHRNEKAPDLPYVTDRTHLLDVPSDPLDAAIDLYAGGGKWVGRKWVQESADRDHSIVATGYAYLETPVLREGSRTPEYPHAWVETVFSVARQCAMSRGAWWSRYSTDAGVFWAFKVPAPRGGGKGNQNARKTDAKIKTVILRLTEAERALLQAKGGPEFLRSAINKFNQS